MPELQTMPTSTNPRSTCVQALQRWEGGGVFADEVLHDALNAARFNSYDRAFLTETFYGVLRHRTALDFLIGRLRESTLDASTRQILRLGFYQIFKMRIPHHAAVNETVNLAGRARGLVNALLRRSIREKEELTELLASAPLDIRASHPAFLVERWKQQFGEENAEKLCAWNNLPAEIFVRANSLIVTPGELCSHTSGAEELERFQGMIKVRQVPYPWIARGLCYVQDPSTLMAVELLAAKPGERVLDACAAPGGKASHIAEQMKNEGVLIASDSSKSRLERLRENLTRLNVRNAAVHRFDWSHPNQDEVLEGGFDRILVDAPCSNTGVIRRRVDVRWRLEPDDFTVMPSRQRAIVENLLPHLKPGGTLVYSTCSLETEENEEVANEIAQQHPELTLVETRRRQPFEDGVDGAFAAKFVKCG